MYNYNHLYYFYLIVKLDGVTNAASFLNTSQSSLSTQMKQFEEFIGKKLFTRNGRKLSLTSEGQTIFSYCKASFEVFEEMRVFLENKNNTGRNKLRIGVGNEVERPFVSSIVSNLIKKDVKNNSTVSLISDSHKSIAELFLTREVDLVVTSDPIHANGIKFAAVINLPVGVVYNSRLFKDKDKQVDFKKLIEMADLGLALPMPSLKLRKEIDTFLTKNKIIRNVSYESNVVSTIVRTVLDGTAVTILPLAYIQNEINHGRLVVAYSKVKYWNHQLYIYSYSETLLSDLCIEIESFSSVEIIKKLSR